MLPEHVAEVDTGRLEVDGAVTCSGPNVEPFQTEIRGERAGRRPGPANVFLRSQHGCKPGCYPSRCDRRVEATPDHSRGINLKTTRLSLVRSTCACFCLSFLGSIGHSMLRRKSVTDETATNVSARTLDRPFTRALRNAVSDVKGISGLILALAGVIAAYVTLQHATPLPPPWPIVGSLVPIPIFLLFYVWPEWRDAVAQRKLKELGIHGRLQNPGYFRLTPYEEHDSGNYLRPDAADVELTRWITNASSPILYVSGQSGAGKSSVLNAGVTPALRKADPSWVVITTRPQDDPLAAIKRSLGAPDIIWHRPPRDTDELISLLDRAAEYLRNQDVGLLLIIDQFEEALILLDDNSRKPLAEFLSNLSNKPRSGLTVLLSLRSEYLADLESFSIPPPTLGRNCFEVRPFTQAAAHEFIERSGLVIGQTLMDSVFDEVAEIEDMPDRVRPVVLNMMGLVLASFKGSLPKGVSPGRLLSGYVRNSIASADIRSVAPKLLRPLVTSLGTKRALSLTDLANAAGVPPTVARGCLIRLADSGLVRTVDRDGTRWELAHDFVARLVQPIVQNWRQTVWEMARPWLAPSALIAWLAILGSSSYLFSTWHLNSARRQLDSAGLSLAAQPKEGGNAVLYNGQEVYEDPFKKATVHLSEVYAPVTSLDFSNAKHLSSLEGMFIPPTVTSLNLRSSGIATLAGMEALRKLAKLDLSRTSLSDLAGSPELPALTELSLSSTNLKSVSRMQIFPALRVLDLSYNWGLNSLAGMPVQPELAILNLTRTGLENLAGFPAFPKLTELRLGSSSLTSLAGMPVLPSLITLILADMPKLSLSSMPVQPLLATVKLSGVNISGMPDQPQLASLELSDSNLAGMPRLSSLTKLKLSSLNLAGMLDLPALRELELEDVPLAGLPALSKLAALTISSDSYIGNVAISFSGMPVLPSLTSLRVGGGIFRRVNSASLTGMPVQPKLASINFSHSMLKSLDDMPLLPALTELDLSDTPLSNLVGMPNLPKLATLDVSNTELTTLEGMPLLPSLTELRLSASNLKSLVGLPNFAKLTKLFLQKTPLNSLKGMPPLANLSTLYLGSLVQDLDELPVLPKLEKLYLDSAELASLESMSMQPALTTLRLVGAKKLRTVAGLPALPNLTSLDLEDAKEFMSLDGLERLPALEVLDVSGTKVTSLEALPRLTKLRRLYLSAEQVQSIPKWMKLEKLSIRGKALPSLRAVQDIQESPTELILGVESVSDWSALSQLANLEVLTLTGVALPPPTILAKLSKLKNLNLQRPGKIDLSPLATLKQDITIEIPQEAQKFVQIPKIPNISVKLTCMGRPCESTTQ